MHLYFKTTFNIRPYFVGRICGIDLNEIAVTTVAHIQ